MLKISNSRINTFRKCHYSHYLKYVLKLIKRAKAGPLQRGSIIHECIEAYNNGKSWIKPFKAFEEEFYKSTFAEERIELGDIPKMVQELLENYFHYYEEEELDYVQNELHFVLPLIKGIEIEGYIDAVVEDDKGLWAMETKTYSKTPDRDFLVFNNQSAIYTWALEELNFKPSGTLWNIIKAKEPTRPKITEKTKKLSLSKLDSTPYTIRKGIVELGLDPENFIDFIDSHSYENYFMRQYIRNNPKVVKLVMTDVISTAKEILESGEFTKDRNLSKDCSWCSYKSICQAELMGLDTEYIIKTEFKVKEEEDKRVEKEDKKSGKKARNRK